MSAAMNGIDQRRIGSSPVRPDLAARNGTGYIAEVAETLTV